MSSSDRFKTRFSALVVIGTLLMAGCALSDAPPPEAAAPVPVEIAAAPAKSSPEATPDAAAETPASWGDVPFDRQEAIHDILAAYVDGSPPFTVSPAQLIYALEWKTLLIDAGWSFDPLASDFDGSLPSGILIQTNKENETNAHILQQAFKTIDTEAVVDVSEEPSLQDIRLIIGSR